MTFLEYCEKENEAPLSEWQKNYISNIQKAIEEGRSLHIACGRGSAKRDTMLYVLTLYGEWKESDKHGHV